MRLVYTFRLSLSVLLALFAAQPAFSEIQCVEDSAAVVVTVHRFSQGPPAYSFVVENNAKFPIKSLRVGWGQDSGPVVRANVSNVPASIGSPKGWLGAHVLKQADEKTGRFMYYSWTLDYSDGRARILPGESLAGFSIQLPTRSESAAPVDYEGRRVVQNDLTKVPFRVYSAYRTCHTGMVRVDR